MRIGVLLYQGVDLLDAGGPYEVFLTASRLVGRDGSEPPFEVVTISPDGAPVVAYGGLGLTPQVDASHAGPLDVLVVPGTMDLDSATADQGLMAAIERLGAGADLTTSVCTGSYLLGAAGLIGDRPWTTHWEDIDLLAPEIGPSGATHAVRWVDAGDVVTSGGLSSGIAMALHLVDRLAGRDLAERTARQIDYDWDPVGGSDAADPAASPARSSVVAPAPAASPGR